MKYQNPFHMKSYRKYFCDFVLMIPIKNQNPFHINEGIITPNNILPIINKTSMDYRCFRSWHINTLLIFDEFMFHRRGFINVASMYLQKFMKELSMKHRSFRNKLMKINKHPNECINIINVS